MTLTTKISENEIDKKELQEFRFVPMLENKEWGNH
jgi:hypothetical protein